MDQHAAMFYRSPEEYLGAVVPFISEGLAKAQPVWAALPPDKLALLRCALGDSASRVAWVDICEMGRNPGCILAAELAFAERHRHRAVRMVTEPMWPGRSALEYPACIQHEALVNKAFGDYQVAGLCPYDASLLDDAVLADIRATHPLIRWNGTRERSADYDVDVALARCNQPLGASPAAVRYTVARPLDLAGGRRYGNRYARLLGLPADRVADLQLVITELATNSLQHGGTACRLSLWEYERHLVCEARDTGVLADPLAGRRPPSRDKPSSSGLFVVNAVVDLLRMHTTPEGTTIHAYLRLDRVGGMTAANISIM
ncbi:anti-sigma regulatory factor [Mycobacterium sp. MFM001]|uniref:anti-sigma factor RsbA family regulatory protein n=1 Tax=Mycobacterium sp. MFM001 TaxID=2049453 RepID=UPI000DA52DF6|nr:anti-sigma factor RsbA family regulatory protein [Mycobacterium sp. MFM001]GBE65442.1 anti-sigma regulatory factor [Mycobacterium sp. MFM001]